MTFTTRSLLAVSAAAAATLLSLPAAAQSTTSGTGIAPRTQFGTTGYIGLNLGRSRFDASCGPAAFTCDDSDTAVNIYAGSMFSNYFGLEAGYLHFGEMSRGGGDTKAQGLNLSLVGKVPVATSLGLFGKIGTTYSRTRTSAAAGSGVATGDENGFGLSYGVGVSYDFTPRMSAVLAWDSHDVRFAGGAKDPIRTTTIGLQYKY